MELHEIDLLAIETLKSLQIEDEGIKLSCYQIFLNNQFLYYIIKVLACPPFKIPYIYKF